MLNGVCDAVNPGVCELLVSPDVVSVFCKVDWSTGMRELNGFVVSPVIFEWLVLPDVAINLGVE